jgi:hypothetical protein
MLQDDDDEFRCLCTRRELFFILLLNIIQIDSDISVVLCVAKLKFFSFSFFFMS